MSGPGIVVRRTNESILDRASRPGESDRRPCGCTNDPLVFGHACVLLATRREAPK